MAASPKKNKTIVLTNKQNRALRGEGHHLAPKVYLGKEGLSASVLASLEAVLVADELVKVKVGNNCPLERHEAAAELAAQSGASVVQVLGKTILLYRANPDLPADRRRQLPG